jgi:hypothetical protein
LSGGDPCRTRRRAQATGAYRRRAARPGSRAARGRSPDIIHNLFFEWGMIALAFAVGSYSLFHGYIKHHRSLYPVFVFSFGFIFLVLKQFFTQYEILFLLIAVTFIISAHYYNYRLCHRSKCSSPLHKH